MNSFAQDVLLGTRNVRLVGALGLACLFFVLVGPFEGLGGDSLADRFLFWGPLFVLALPAGVIARKLVDGLLTPSFVIQYRLLIALFFSGLYVPALKAVALVYAPQGKIAAYSLVLMFVATFLLAVAGAIFVSLSDGRIFDAMTQNKASEKTDAPVLPRLYRRLELVGTPLEIGRLTVSDHYVVVFLSDDSTRRVLMRLSDAIAEMDGVRGFTTHRSHWVAAEYISKAVREGARDFLILKCGAKVPVSRTYRGDLADAGYL